MSYYQDLSPFSELGLPPSESVLAVGWLDAGNDYKKGQVSRDVADSLLGLLSNVWEPGVTAGRHRCTFCYITGGPTSIYASDRSIELGSSNLYLPSESQKVLYVAPSLIVHYMDAHEYLPPAEFQEAVLRCPPMRSLQYFKLLLKVAPTEFKSRYVSKDLTTGTSPGLT